ncbi:MAG: hypothetical protein M3M85_02800 [bacterium]|nr:hypothetical protein [bacterium]
MIADPEPRFDFLAYEAQKLRAHRVVRDEVVFDDCIDAEIENMAHRASDKFKVINQLANTHILLGLEDSTPLPLIYDLITPRVRNNHSLRHGLLLPLFPVAGRKS